MTASRDGFKLVRKVWVRLLLLGTVIVLGLLSRKYSGVFPVEIQKYPGSALWALAVFLAYGLVIPKASTSKLTAYALITAIAVEVSQLLDIAWLNDIRNTKIGHLFLGSTFNAPDLIAYAIGIAVGLVAEKKSPYGITSR
jgi:Protein of unknown function (DUF2809)